MLSPPLTHIRQRISTYRIRPYSPKEVNRVTSGYSGTSTGSRIATIVTSDITCGEIRNGAVSVEGPDDTGGGRGGVRVIVGKVARVLGTTDVEFPERGRT